MHYGHSKNQELAKKICNTIRYINPTEILADSSLVNTIGRALAHSHNTKNSYAICETIAQTVIDRLPNRKGRASIKKEIRKRIQPTVEKFYKKKKTKLYHEASSSLLQHNQKENKMVTEDHSHNDMYKYKVHIPFSNKKSHKRLGYWEYYTQKSGFVYAQEGKQGAAEINAMGHALQIFASENPTSGPSGTNVYKWTVSPYTFNPYKKITANGLYQSVTSPVIDKIHLESIESTTIIANTTIVPVQVEIAWLTPKKAQPDGPVQSWRNLLVDKALGVSANDNPDYSALPVNYPGVAQVTEDMYGQSPFGHKEFRRQWKTLHRKSFYLNAGDQRKIMQTIHYNRTWDKEALKQVMNPNDVNNASTALAGWASGISICVMLIVRPGIVVVPEKDGSRPSVVTTGLGEVTFVNSDRYCFSSMGSTDRISTAIITPTLIRESASLKTGRVLDTTDQMRVDDEALENK